jgi:hypothetical protein
MCWVQRPAAFPSGIAEARKQRQNPPLKRDLIHSHVLDEKTAAKPAAKEEET